jgi:putative endopeptidase
MLNFKGIIKVMLLTASLVGVVSCGQPKEEAPAEVKVKAIDSANFDFSVNPGDDFFKYTNGNWMKNNPIPDEESRWGAFNILNLENQKKLLSLFEEAASGKHSEPYWKQIGDFYASGMDTVKIEELGVKPLKTYFDKIDAIASLDDVLKMTGEMTTYGMSPLFHLYAGPDDKNSNMMVASLYQGGLGLPDRDYYFPKDDRSKNILEEYKKHLVKMFVLYGQTEQEATASCDKIMKIETEIATASSTRLELRDPVKNYNKMLVDDLQKKTMNFNWTLYFSTIGITKPADIVVGQPKFMEAISKIIKSVPVEDWKIFFKWKIMNESAAYLNNAFVNQNFEFYGKVLSGSKVNQERWKRVLNTTSGSLGEAVGKIYSEKYFPASSKEKMLKLVGNLRIALKEHITNLTWMSEETKAKALTKLEKINVKIGYPDKWKDYSSIQVAKDSYLTNVINTNIFEVKDNLMKIGKPVDRAEWGMTPQTVNAYYSPNMNEIVFPAAILQPPFFFPDGDDAVNYGAIGVVIGHEMTHGFDDQGRQFDANGNLFDWWTPEDAAKFTEKVQIFVQQANAYTVIDSMKVNGELTLGENIADFGGLTVSLTALKKALNGNISTPAIDGFTPLQRYFIAYSQVWRQNIRDEEAIRRIKEDVHSPGEYRVNGTIPNIPEFYEAFGIKENNKLFCPVDKRALIW